MTTPRFPDNPLDRFITDLKNRGRLAKAPARNRCKRIAKKIRKRGGFLRCPKASDTPPPAIDKIARATIAVAALLVNDDELDAPYTEAEEAEFDQEWNR